MVNQPETSQRDIPPAQLKRLIAGNLNLDDFPDEAPAQTERRDERARRIAEYLDTPVGRKRPSRDTHKGRVIKL